MAKGLYGKYIIRKADGAPMGDDFKFVLSPEKDRAALVALRTYASETDNGELKSDLLEFIATIDKKNKVKTVGTTCSHRNQFSYNHGYHTICEDCGEEI